MLLILKIIGIVLLIVIALFVLLLVICLIIIVTHIPKDSYFSDLEDADESYLINTHERN